MKKRSESWVWPILFSIMLTFGGSIEPAQAHCEGKHTGNHPHCSGGGEPPQGNPVIVFQKGSDIVLADADGSNQTVVYSDVSLTIGPPSWCSPDGTDIVFPNEINGITGIYVLDVVEDNNGVRTPLFGQEPQLIADTDPSGLASCSPHKIGDKIKVVYGGDNTKNLYLTNADGTGGDGQGGPPIPLSSGEQRGKWQWWPSWSPDGSRIAFESLSSLPPNHYEIEILSIEWDPDGNPMTIYCCDSLVEHPDSLGGPKWSNLDNEDSPGRIAVSRGNEIWIIPVEEPWNGYRVAYDDFAPVRADVAWSPDDSQLIYLRNPRRGMCGEGDGKRVKGAVIGISNVNDGTVILPIGNDDCDEIALIRDGRFPHWWPGDLGDPSPPAP